MPKKEQFSRGTNYFEGSVSKILQSQVDSLQVVKACDGVDI